MAYIQKHSTKNLPMKLVCGDVQKFVSEFKLLIDTLPTWFADAVAESGAGQLPDEVLGMVQGMTLKLVVRLASSFDSRVVQPLARPAGPDC